MIMPEEIVVKSEKHESVKEKIRARQHQVHILHLQDLTNQEIADKLDVSVSTVEKDLHEIRENIKSWFVEYRQSGKYLAFKESCEQLAQIQKELWQHYHQEKDPKTKVRILESLADKIAKYDAICIRTIVI